VTDITVKASPDNSEAAGDSNARQNPALKAEEIKAYLKESKEMKRGYTKTLNCKGC
jgi:hypothetical protein